MATVGNVLTYRNTGLTNGTTYWFQVAAVNTAGAGTRSNEVSATPATTPSPPRTLKVARVTEGFKLTWVAPSSAGGSAVVTYKIYRTDGSGGSRTFSVPATALTYTDTALAPKTWYAYIVTAINGVGESTSSNIVTIKSP